MGKEPKTIGPRVWILLIVAALAISVVGVVQYTKQPDYQLRQYIKAVNSRDYLKVYDTFFQEKGVAQFSREEIIGYMKKYGQELNFIRVEKGKASYKDSQKAFFELIYDTQKGKVPQVLGLVKKEGSWKVIFPFKTSQLNIQAPEGAQVLLNGKTLNADEKGETIAGVLPGEYTVRMVYPNGLQQDYVTQVKVPEVSEVVSPYTTIPVEVMAPKGTIVELAGVKKRNITGKVTFEKVLEGNYELKIFDEKGFIEPQIQKIEISKKIKPIQVTDMKLAEKGEEAFKQFVSLFYESYLESIRAGDVDGMASYFEGEKREKLEEDFNGWFINHKQITHAEMTIELDAIAINADGGITADLLEVVTMTNKEQLEANKGQEKQYQVMLRWAADFELSEGGYRLKDRDIVESMVAQKDSKGNWVQY